MAFEGSLNVEPMRTTSKVAFNGSLIRLKVQSRTSVLAPLRTVGGPVVLASGVSGVVSCHVKRVKPTDTSDEDIAARKPEVGRLYNDLQASHCRSAR